MPSSRPFILTFFLASSFVVLIAAKPDEQPSYYKIFSGHNQWEGSYMYNGTAHYCYIFVHSEHYAKKNGLLATFKDREGATIEIEGESPCTNDLEVTFTVHVMFEHVDRFWVNFKFTGESPGTNDLEVTFTVHVMFEHVGRFWENFTFTGVLSQVDGRWQYDGTVTVPNNGQFGAINFHQTDDKLGPYVHEDDSLAWRYTIIIGIPILMAVIGVVGTVAIIYWAIKKGYIRHVPKTYNNFDNPVQFDSNKEAVHI